ncbi:MAG: filamentous hemagglutinin N-terminal domain-containing protein, partial [Nitrospinae bacterium]|nr:filamentous hemagglutinin N-terminal domain-containing protein [Nitrospinota bacterium]
MRLSKLVNKVIAVSLACLISGIGFPVSLVFALPQDGNIVGGQGNIHQHTAQDLHIHQDTSNLIINWQGFNIGAAESVQFSQPGIDSVALNRVIGIDPSIIAGRLSANGQVFITNPSGVIFLPGSQVDVHGLLATTLSISDQDFLNRTYNFFQDPSRSLASILNEGTINASYVGL